METGTELSHSCWSQGEILVLTFEILDRFNLPFHANTFGVTVPMPCNNRSLRRSQILVDDEILLPDTRIMPRLASMSLVGTFSRVQNSVFYVVEEVWQNCLCLEKTEGLH